jgi:PKD repeat protein
MKLPPFIRSTLRQSCWMGLSIVLFAGQAIGQCCTQKCQPCENLSCVEDPANFAYCVWGCTVYFCVCNTGEYHHWDFGDGTSITNDCSGSIPQFPAGATCDASAASNPVHTYSSPGTYTVIHRFKFANGSNVYTKTATITITNQMNPAFTLQKQTDCEEVCVTVAHVSDVFCNWNETWNFGDGTILAGTVETLPCPVTHCYQTEGAFTITHTLNSGCASQSSSQVVVVDFTNPLALDAGFTFGNQTGCTPTQVPFFSDANPPGVTHQWQINNVSVSTATNPVLSFAQNGAYLITHIVTEPVCNTSQSFSQTIQINGSLPVADFDFETETRACGEVEICFYNISHHEITAYLWNFGDGTTSTEFSPCHTYTQAGTYTVVLTATNDCGTDSYQQPVTINPGDLTYDFVIGSLSPGGYQSLSQAVIALNMPTTLLSASVLVQGVLEINTDMFHCINSTIVMDAGAEIIVLVDNSFTVENTNVLGCDQRWQALTVEEEATLRVVAGSRIEDGQYAIRPMNKSTVEIRNSVFNKNFISVFFNDPGEFVLLPFFGNRFECTEALLPHFNGQDPLDGPWSFAGMLINGQETLNIGVHGAALNQFEDLRNGILASDCNLTLVRTTFRNITDNNDFEDIIEGVGIFAEGSGYTLTQDGLGQGGALSFDNCATGIFATNIRVERIRNNNMRGMGTGIRAERIPSLLKITNNTIDTRSLGISLLFIEPTADATVGPNIIHVRGQKGYGIVLNQTGIAPVNSNFDLLNNDVHLYNTQSGGVRMFTANGVSLFDNDVFAHDAAVNFSGYLMSGSHNSTWQCNTATGLGSQGGTGISALDAENTTWNCNDFVNTQTGMYLNMGGWSPGLFTGTDFSGNQWGLLIDDGNNVSPGMLGPQSHRGNRWLNGAAARHESDDPQTVQNSLFFVHTTVPPYRPPVSIVFPVIETDFFFLQNGNPNTQCLSSTACPEDQLSGEVVEIKPIDELIANGEFGSYSSESRWLAERYLYRKLQRYPELVTFSSSIQTFFSEKTDKNIGQFFAVEQALRDLFVIDSAVAAKLDANYAGIAANMQEIADLDSSLITAIGQDSLLLLQQRLTTALETDSLTLVQTGLLSDIQTERSDAADPIIAANAAIVTTEVFEANEQIVNEIFLETWAKGIFSSDSVQLTALENVAFQCPLTGGTAVFRARAMLSLAGDYDFGDDELNCQGIGERAESFDEKNLNQADNVSLLPNPAISQVEVRLPKNDSGGVLYVLDNLGRLVLHQEFLEDQFTFSANSHPNGIYTCQFILNNQKFYKSKLAIAH